MLTPGFPCNVYCTAPNRRCTGRSIVIVAAQVTAPWNPRASTAPPVAGNAAIALLICAHGSAPGKPAALSVPFTFCAVRVVNVPALGVTFPIGAGDARFTLPLPHPVHVPLTVRFCTVAFPAFKLPLCPIRTSLLPGAG